MKNRLVIALTVLALALVPCGKIAAAFAKTAAPASVAFTHLIATLHDGGHPVAHMVVPEPDDADPVCLKSCKTWQGVVPRTDDLGTPAANTLVVVEVLVSHQAWPKTASDLNTLGARSPPEPAGSAFDRIFATTSRFLS